MTDLPTIILDEFIIQNTDYAKLVQVLRQGFTNEKNITPIRHHHDFVNPNEDKDSTLLLMPSFNIGSDMGVKIVAVHPNNAKYSLPTIQGTYLYLDAVKGRVKAIMDAKLLTNKRTACTSALASTFLSKQDASSMLLIGTGALAVDMIRAHAAVRPIKNVYIWGRNFDAARKICDTFTGDAYQCTAIQDYNEIISDVDIISCATLSPNPLIFGKKLQPGQHIDLVGSYKKDMREADDDSIMRASIFLDTYQGGLKESGDIFIPLQTGILKMEDIKADLYELCRLQKIGRTSDQEITLFKSVGHASEDLAAAAYYYQLFNNQF